jgi:Ca-activated chloride channel family protein
MYKDLQILIRKNKEIINIQTPNEVTKYLTGKYDLEVLSLPRISISDVEINQSKTTSITIPQPGLVTIFKPTTGPCSLFVQKGDKLEWIYNIPEETLRETLTLQPGTYHLIFRNKSAYLSQSSRKASFEITSGKSIPVRL